MPLAVILLALGLLIFAAYRGVSVILFAPVAALLAVILTNPELTLPVFSGVFMERMVGFIKLYFPVFLLGAAFGKLMEISGFARSIIHAVLQFIGPPQAIIAVVLVCAILTYGGVSLFVVAFAVYPFAAELFRSSNIPKRLLPATIALGAFTFTMDALPGSPQIQNIIPTTFFGTNSWAAPVLGVVGSLVVLAGGIGWLEWRRRSAQSGGEGYGEGHTNEPAVPPIGTLPHPLIATAPLLLVGVVNWWLTGWMPGALPSTFDFAERGLAGIPAMDTTRLIAVWSVLCALALAIAVVVGWCLALRVAGVMPALNAAVGGAMLAALNTGSEYGFGAVIAVLPGFGMVSTAVSTAIEDPLMNVAVTTNVLAGITGSASGGMSLALGAMSEAWVARANQEGISHEVLHRVAAMASGGMDTLPHNGAIITLLAITGLTHRQAYRDIFLLTLIKVAAAFFVIAVHRWTGII
ncbi:MAG TPA: GntP family permease [Bryobacteraceae bacterium]|nr:GntP family permease [Bryobacteraceae bacterium]